MAVNAKAKYWTVVMYPENMIPNWETEIDDVLQVPYAYCVHNIDKDSKSEHRKDHVHILLAFSNTTTYSHVMEVCQKLNAPKKKAFNTVEKVVNVRHMYDYLIHDTESCKKKGKELYPVAARVTGNNFDIGSFEQLSQLDKDRMLKELCQHIVDNEITNFADVYVYIMGTLGDEYFEVLKTYSGLIERLICGVYHKRTTQEM